MGKGSSKPAVHTPKPAEPEPPPYNILILGTSIIVVNCTLALSGAIYASPAYFMPEYSDVQVM